MTYRGQPFQLPVLGDASRSATPCSARADEPTRGRGRARYCWRCGRDVYDIASLSPADARAVMGLPDGAPCPPLRVRRDGTVMKRDCPVAVRTIRVRRCLAAAGAVVALAAAVSVPWASVHGHCDAAAERPRDRYEFLVRPNPTSPDSVVPGGANVPSGAAELVRVTRQAVCRDTSAGTP